MDFEIVTCPNCGAEHSPGYSTCLNCGSDLSHVTPAVELSEDMAGLRSNAAASAEEARDHFRQIIRFFSNKGDFFVNSWVAPVELPGNRSQDVKVFFNSNGNDKDPVRVSYLAICGRADDAVAMKLLKQNARLNYARFAVLTIKGIDMFVVYASHLAETAQRSEVRKTLEEVAAQADAVEKMLSAGKDRH